MTTVASPTWVPSCSVGSLSTLGLSEGKFGSQSSTSTLHWCAAYGLPSCPGGVWIVSFVGAPVKVTVVVRPGNAPGESSWRPSIMRRKASQSSATAFGVTWPDAKRLAGGTHPSSPSPITGPTAAG